MKPSPDLFHLIKSLSRSEKRYFKLFAGKSTTDQNYLKLFSAIDKLDHYNEKALVDQLNNPTLTRQLPVLKNYLYKLILKSLRNFKADKSIDFQIKELLMNVELLMDRDLLSPAQKQLDKAQRLVLEQERFEYMAEIGILATSLQVRTGQERLSEIGERFDAILQQTSYYKEVLITIETYRNLSLKLLLLNRKESVIRSEHIRAAYEQVIAHPLLQEEAPTSSVRAGMFYHQCKAIYNLAHGQFPEAFLHFDGLIELMEANPWTIQRSPQNYLATLQNRIQVSKQFRPATQTLSLVQELRDHSENSPKAKLPRPFLRTMILFGYRMELEMLMKEGQVEAAKFLVGQIREELDTNRFRINLNEGYVILELYLCLVHFYIATHQLIEALRFANLLVNTPEISKEYEIFLDAQILKIIVLFDLKETELFESAMKSLYRYMKEHERIHAFERAIFNYLRKRMRMGPGQALRPLVEELHQTLVEIREHPGEQLGLQPFDSIGWLEKVLATEIT